jgi:hypothetical protein
MEISVTAALLMGIRLATRWEKSRWKILDKFPDLW